MGELCKSHDLALAPDGKCILCRRPAMPRFAVRQETEDLLSRIVTGALLVCLVSAVGALGYVWRLDPAYLTGSPAVGTGWIERAVEDAPAAIEDAPAAVAPARAIAAQPSPPTPAASAAPDARGGPPPQLASAATRTRAVRIVMFSAPWCYVCDRARDFLGTDVVALVERDVEREPAAARELAAKNPLQTLPTFVVRGRTLVGFSPYDLEQAVREGLASEHGSPLLAAGER